MTDKNQEVNKWWMIIIFGLFVSQVLIIWLSPLYPPIFQLCFRRSEGEAKWAERLKLSSQFAAPRGESASPSDLHVRNQVGLRWAWRKFNEKRNPRLNCEDESHFCFNSQPARIYQQWETFQQERERGEWTRRPDKHGEEAGARQPQDHVLHRHSQSRHTTQGGGESEEQDSFSQGDQ